MSTESQQDESPQEESPQDESARARGGMTIQEVFALAARIEAERGESRPRKHRIPGEKPSDMDPASGWLEARDFEAPLPGEEPEEDRDRRRRTYSRQVGIRLSWSQYAELGQAAELYGVAPGTMARMLVKRGSKAILDSRRRYDLEQGGAD